MSDAASEPKPTLNVEYIDTRGKVSDNANQESPSFEVERVTLLVLEHAYRRPERSLAVVTASPKHAQRVAGAVRNALNKYPQLAPFFKPGKEPFRVVDFTRAEGMERDTMIFSLGWAVPAPTSAPLHDGAAVGGARPGGARDRADPRPPRHPHCFVCEPGCVGAAETRARRP